LCACAAFFGRLENQHQRPCPTLPRRDQELRRREQTGDVHIVPASVHDRFLHPVSISHAFRRRIRQTRLLFHGEGIEVRAKQDRRARAVEEQGGYACSSNAGADVEGGGDGGSQVFGDCGGGFVFLVRELRVGVEVFVEGLVGGEVWTVLFY